MSDAPEKIVYIATYAGEDAERASFPFMLANAALAMDVEAVMVLQGNAVWLAKKGYAQHVHAAGLPPMEQLVGNFMELGGKMMVCTPCIKHRNIEVSDLIDGAEPVAGGSVNQELLTANASVAY
jgi:uncharacterized protein involved in oxidation of intracellular sulfur